MSEQHLTWGDTLWDQWDRVQQHTEVGLDFTKKCQDFVRDRIKCEQDYAKNLRRLRKQYRLKNIDDDTNNFTTVKAYVCVLNQLDLVARDHELLCERLQTEVTDPLKILHKESTNNRKNLCNTASQLQQEYKEWQTNLERQQLKYEKMAKEADTASQAFSRIDADINATKAQVEKSRSAMTHRQDLMEKSKGDYIIAVETTNNNQHQYYHERWPSLLNQMQRGEEMRIEEMKRLLVNYCKQHSDILPHVTQCVETMSETCQRISHDEDSELFMEERSNQPFPSDHQFTEFGARPPTGQQNFGSHNASTRKTKRERKKTKIFGRNFGGSSESVNKDGFENLPPEKRKKAFKEKIKEIEGKINIELKARTALEEILELYSQKPELGSASAMEDSRQQLDDITTTLERLQEELYKYQCYLAALADKPVPEKPHLGSHLQSDAVSITSSVSHISHVSHSAVETETQQEPPEFIPVSPTSNNFQSDTYYEVPDPAIIPPPPDLTSGLPTSSLNQCSVLYDYAAQHGDELDIFAGEVLYVVEDNGTGWVKAQRNDNEIGLVPGNYIEMLC